MQPDVGFLPTAEQSQLPAEPRPRVILQQLVRAPEAERPARPIEGAATRPKEARFFALSRFVALFPFLALVALVALFPFSARLARATARSAARCGPGPPSCGTAAAVGDVSEWKRAVPCTRRVRL